MHNTIFFFLGGGGGGGGWGVRAMLEHLNLSCR